jgi:hypothetical protein
LIHAQIISLAAATKESPPQVCPQPEAEERVDMELNTVLEIVWKGLSFVLPVVAVVIPFLAKSGVGKSLCRHISFSIWHRRMRKAGFSKKKIRKMIAEAALADLTQ